MFLIYLIIYAVLIILSLIGARKYNDKLLFWCAGVGATLLAASIWQYVAANIFMFPTSIQTASLLIIEVLRLIIIILLVFAAIKIFARS
jgi:hypothetical protein